MKKLLAILLSVFMLMTLIACDNGDKTTNTDTESTTEIESTTETETTADTNTDTETETDDDDVVVDMTLDAFLTALAEANAEMPSDFRAELNAAAGMNMTILEETQNQTINISADMTVDGDNVLLTLTPPQGGDVVEITFADGTLYISSPSADDQYACTVTEEQMIAYFEEMLNTVLGGMLGGSTEGDASSDIITSIPGLDTIPGLEEMMATLEGKTIADMVGQYSIITDPATGNYEVSMVGISDTVVTFAEGMFQLIMDMAGSNMEIPEGTEGAVADTLLGMMASYMEFINTLKNPENFFISIECTPEMRLLSFDIHVMLDLSALVSTDDSENSMSMFADMSVNVAYDDQTVTAPDDAADYTEITFEEMMDGMFGNEGEAEEEETLNYGTLMGIFTDDDGYLCAVISTFEFGQERLYTFYIPEYMEEDITALLNLEVYFECNDDTLTYIEDATVNTTTTLYVVGYISSFDADNGVLIMNAVETEDDGTETTEPVTIVVPVELTEAVLAINSETCMAFATCEQDPENFNLVLADIEPWACSAE